MKKIVAWLGIAVALFSAPHAEASDKIAKIIKQLSPQISEENADSYAKIIRKCSAQYGIDWRIAVAIFKQESNFVLDEVNLDYQDFGIGQINWKNIKSRRLSVARLLNDPEYAIEQTFIILAELKAKYSGFDYGHLQWFTRYHSFSADLRREYWYGKEKKQSGLAYKLKLISELEKNYEQEDGDGFAGDSLTTAQLGFPGRKGKRSFSPNNQKWVLSRLRSSRLGEDVRGIPRNYPEVDN